jgi:hypothetical protein
MDAAFAAEHPGAGPGRYVALSVADNGPGIEPHLLPLLFKPFFTTKEPGIATGLGLAAVYGIVKQSGGYVSVESDVGRGSTFTMYFPASVGPPVLASPPHPASPVDTRGSETILLAEDDAGLRGLLRRVLEAYGYTVLEAVDGLDATTRWLGEVGRIDLLITDLVMPGLTGVEVARLFREARPALPIIFATGYADPAIYQGLSMDARMAIVHKPFLPSLLLGRVRALLGSNGLPSPEPETRAL